MGTRITSKGQVTIPKKVRRQMGFEPGDELDWVPVNGRLEVRKAVAEDPFKKWRGAFKGLAGMDVDELIEEMRGR
ncbi:MAG TPA: AbrB/MazE/SpoVT family DNA-binding domain-containing protein [Dehalococcoidia bacterium]|nr:AbrB/MazE/SpoVT family DNA-binding domain-containing protein [Dehalococcoidia bacterium]